MKKTACLLLLLFTFISTTAQDKISTDFKRNEIKLNALSLILGAAEVTYERALSEESGIGMNVLIAFDDDVFEDLNFYISPYYRFYFGKKPAAGFFIEGFGLFSSLSETEAVITIIDGSENEIPNGGFVVRETNAVDFALGIGLGGKWITNSGFVGEIGLGIGRNLFNNDIVEPITGKVLITVGYRF